MLNLADTVKEFSGNVVCLGVTENHILKNLGKNKNAVVFTIDRDPSKSLFFRHRKTKVKEKGKKINIRKLRKTFKRKSVDYIVCNFNEISDSFKYFIYDSVVINRGTLYLYGDSKYVDAKQLSKRFKRFHAKAESFTSGDYFLIVVDNRTSRGNWIKYRWYLVVDTFHNLGDMISAALIS